MDFWINKLNYLFNPECSKEQAAKIWNTFFKQPIQKQKSALPRFLDVLGHSLLDLKITISDRNGDEKYIYNPQGYDVIPKGMDIEFSAKTSISLPYQIEWEVQNDGDEAEFAGQHISREGLVDKDDSHYCNEKSAYRGDHSMTCRIFKDGALVRERRVEVRIR